MTGFTLRDTEDVLTEETFTHIDAALERATVPLWAGRPWLIIDPVGRPAYSRRYPREVL